MFQAVYEPIILYDLCLKEIPVLMALQNTFIL
jgi:hypothetical protein